MSLVVVRYRSLPSAKFTTGVRSRDPGQVDARYYQDPSDPDSLMLIARPTIGGGDTTVIRLKTGYNSAELGYYGLDLNVM